MIIKTKTSHLDENLTAGQLDFILKQFSDRKGKISEVVVLPEHLGTVDTKDGPTRMVSVQAGPATVPCDMCGGKDEGRGCATCEGHGDIHEDCVVFGIFGGTKAPWT